MSTDSYEPLSEELYWRKKIGDEIRESITRMRVKQGETELRLRTFGCLPSCEKENQLNSIIRAYQNCENIVRGQKDRN